MKCYNVSYTSDKHVEHLGCTIGMTALSPVVYNTGIYVSGNVQCDVIPFSIINLEKNSDNSDKDYTKVVFNRFSPGDFVESGLFHVFKKGDTRLHVFLGFGYGYYDPFSAYRNCIIMGHNLSKAAPTSKNYYQIRLRLICLH